MADPELLAILKQGSEVWNAYRRNRGHFVMDFSRANIGGWDLTHMYLSGADFRRANLTEADIRNAFLNRVDFRGAILSSADCRGTDFNGSDFTGALLRKSVLTGAQLNNTALTNAELVEADLRYANLNGARLGGANLSLVMFKETGFSGTDLSGARHLDQCQHSGPSTIDHRTLTLSSGLPTAFLRGVGLSDEAIWAYTHDTTVTIEFKRDVWGQLFPIEYALVATLGSNFTIEKDPRRLLVKLEAPDQIQGALDAIIPALASLEAVSRGEVGTLAVKPEGQDEVTIRDERLSSVLAAYARDITRETPPDVKDIKQEIGGLRDELEARSEPAGQELTLAERSVRELARGVPIVGDLLALWISETFKRTDSAVIFARFKKYFVSSMGVMGLRDAAPRGDLDR